VVIFLATTPYGAENASTALRLAAAALAKGHRVTLALIQDAVLGALRGSQLESARQLRALIEGGTECQYLAHDLTLRGYAPDDVMSGCAPGDEAGIVDVLLADGGRVAGAF
jgi:sulfur relay (sulfurtransferase) complex TusBCD TusD component (DsrE family)